MVRNKTLLVALREYAENLRTKTFWLGIMSFPVILIIGAVVPNLLAKAKDVRRYVVIDQAGWLLPAIEERAQYDDVLQLLKFVQKQAEKGPSAVARMPAALRSMAAGIKDKTIQQLEAEARVMTARAKLLSSLNFLIEPLLKANKQKTEVKLDEFLDWMVNLSPEEARSLKAGIKRERYERVEIPKDAWDPIVWARSKIESGDLFAYFVIGKTPLDGNEGFKYVSKNRTDHDLRDWIGRLSSAEIEARRFSRENIDPDVARRIQEPVHFDEKQLDEFGQEKEVSRTDVIRQWAPLVFVYLLWVSIFTIAQLLLTNTIEEKSNRIIEVLLSSISPLALMTGKILGIAATGLTTIICWIGFFLLGWKVAPTFMNLPVDVDFGIIISDPSFLLSFVVYFLLGFLLYASMMVGIGSACNSIKEAQNLMSPIMVLLMLPLLAMMPVGQDPNGTLARILSFVPPFTPFVMMNRAAGPPETWEYVATTLLLVISVLVAFYAAAKIFRVGILMTGKPPKLSEIFRWVFAKERP
ncbi:MAG TPA: ABC transporter permease [Planctomycetota bacterium]|nr:ABC transporter permease [Planctomycetota bacterium]